VDLVDDIINQFNSLYNNVKFESNAEKEEDDEEDYNEDNLNYLCEEIEDNVVEELEGSEIDDQLDLEEYSKNKSNRSNLNFKSQKENFNDLPKVENGINISDQNLNLIKNVFKLGEKFTFSLTGLVIKNIALAEISEPKFFVKCSKCKSTAFETNFNKFNKRFNIFFNGVVCPKCKNEMHIFFKSEYLHSNNLSIGGTIFSIGTIIVDYLPTTYMINCINCPNFYKKLKLRNGGLPNNDKCCRNCGQEMIFNIYNSVVNNSFYNDYSFLEDLKINNFQKFNISIENDLGAEYVKKYDRPFQVGNPLPDKGICKHYKYSFRWFRFGCCSKIFPCDLCHDEISTHESDFAKTILCGHCCFEQSSQNPICSKCGKYFTKEVSKRGFWEGGKGCRNKAFMSNKDEHKFKNSCSKTVSRKKRDEMMKNKI
jgi:uncharacterized CHY-type Zn-finger protein